MLAMVAPLLGGCEQPTRPIPAPRGEALAASPCSALTFNGFPRAEPARQGARFVCHDGYALEFDGRPRSALWVTHRLEAGRLANTQAKRTEDFREDPNLPIRERAQLRHFSKTGWDRGHLAPAEDFRDSPRRMSQSFYLSNIVAQHPSNNRYTWSLLEVNVRQWAQDRGELFIVTGPIYEQGQTLGWIGQTRRESNTLRRNYSRRVNKNDWKKQVAVPTHLYKIALDPHRREAIAFILPNEDVPEQDLPMYATTVARAEQATGIRFFPDLTFEEQAAIKTTLMMDRWPIWIPERRPVAAPAS